MPRQFMRRGGARRKTQWGGFGSESGTAALPALVTLTATTSVILSQGIVADGALGMLDEEFTVARVIGHVTGAIGIDTAVTSGTIALGCAVARNEAITAGVASLPSAEDDPDFEWLYYAVFQVLNPQNALRDGPLSGVQFQFDVRGQRIVRKGQSLVWIAESQDSNCVAGVGGRYLIKLT